VTLLKCGDIHRFLFRLTGNDDEINLNGDGSEKPEFGEWTWMTPQEVIEKVDHFPPRTPFFYLIRLKISNIFPFE
jgi:hypothetical protein